MAIKRLASRRKTADGAMDQFHSALRQLASARRDLASTARAHGVDVKSRWASWTRARLDAGAALGRGEVAALLRSISGPSIRGYTRLVPHFGGAVLVLGRSAVPSRPRRYAAGRESTLYSLCHEQI